MFCPSTGFDMASNAQWVCQMIIQAHLEIIVALGIILGWMD
jgi:hypothetical protein